MRSITKKEGVVNKMKKVGDGENDGEEGDG
jgi:hypothetical protein